MGTRALARNGDTLNASGATIVATAVRTFCNGIAIARDGDAVTPHPPGGASHNNATVQASGSQTVYVEGIPVVAVGDSATCGHVVTSGSPNVFVP
jgi:uncharacterized Zn-binding protein involved in type VI secretion